MFEIPDASVTVFAHLSIFEKETVLRTTDASDSRIDRTPQGRWLGVDPTAGSRWFAGLNAPWWIAGGWALDLFLGEQSRPHGDLDIGIPRRDVARVLSHLSSWEIFEAKDGVVTRIDGDHTPRPTVNSLWCRMAQSDAWAFELMLDESIGDQWCYRRDPSIQCSLQTAIRRNESGIPYLAPEIQLLYKARSFRSRDVTDFERVAPHLDAVARRWLSEKLARTVPGHPWLSALAGELRERQGHDPV